MAGGKEKKIINLGVIQYLGIEKWREIRERFQTNCKENDIKQLAFLKKNIDTYLEINGAEKYIYFFTDYTNLSEKIDYDFLACS